MAISKLKAIHQTLGKALAYVTEADKTDGGIWIDTFGCSLGTADLEMAATAGKGRGQGGRMAYHLIQSFSPEDDIMPEKALELGREFAKKVTGGKYEYVVATHVDRSHIHNHIIFNATSFVDHKKYHHSERDKYRIREINDEICRANGFSVIEHSSGQRGKSWYNSQTDPAEGGQKKKKKLTREERKERLKLAMDDAVFRAGSYEEFLSIMELEGYEYRDKGSSLSFKYRLGDPEQSIRVDEDNFGAWYTKDMIRKRILDPELEKKIREEQELKKERRCRNSEESGKRRKKGNREFIPQKRTINSLIDISQNKKAMESPAYERALIRVNLDITAKSMNYLISNKIHTTEEFRKHVSGIQEEHKKLTRHLQIREEEMMDLSEKIKFLQAYKKRKRLYMESIKAGDKSDFLKKHQDELIQIRAAQNYFCSRGLDPDSMDLADLFEQYRIKKQEKSEIHDGMKQLRTTLKDLDIVAHNIEDALGISLSGDRKKDRRSEKRVSPKAEKDR